MNLKLTERVSRSNVFNPPGHKGKRVVAKRGWKRAFHWGMEDRRVFSGKSVCQTCPKQKALNKRRLPNQETNERLLLELEEKKYNKNRNKILNSLLGPTCGPRVWLIEPLTLHHTGSSDLKIEQMVTHLNPQLGHQENHNSVKWDLGPKSRPKSKRCWFDSG